ncbi:transporter substrate-binding domain-containing protein [Brucella pseudogrignonensis]|uniref:Polar amino acid transport system substrate-binding protein n=1 Tax=Brucella pseudogrignonensis TaxID=419475 RepID=A0ABU1MCE3_9HYPH|nr:transporter substrate-binding domain-containing protein [Brucella pseudogrignonensis]MCL7999414.1 transporter substrate-binding domain-containing protein [Brucella sp. 21LCYQ03]MDR6433593.1 polar amino acid transport system substrate-binding protein [Brucella pseudogrignonensis]
MTVFNRRRMLTALGLGLSFMALSLQPSFANQLESIREKGKLQVAIDLGNPPYAMRDAKFEPTGSEVETAKLLAKDLGVEIEFLTVPTSGRIPFLVSGKADLAVSTLSITKERLDVVDFSVPYAETAIVVAAPKESNVKSYADLAGSSVAVTRGTVNDTNLTEKTADISGVQIVRFEDDPTSSAAVTSGQMAIYATSRPLLTELIKANPKLDLEEKFVAQAYPLGIAMRRNEPQLKEWIDAWVKTNLDNGKLVEIYEKYHAAKLDPKKLATMDLPR